MMIEENGTGPHNIQPKKTGLVFWRRDTNTEQLSEKTEVEKTRWRRQCGVGLHALFQLLYYKGLIIHHQDTEDTFMKHHRSRGS